MKLIYIPSRIIILYSLTVCVLSLFFISLNNNAVFTKKLIKLPGVGFLINQREKIQHKAQVITLNYAIPDFTSLVNFLNSPNESGQEAQNYLSYYQMVSNTFPDLPEGYAVLGLLYFYMGDETRAIENFKMAAKLNPNSFYAYYNLGLLYLIKAEYQEAADALKKAVGCDPKKVIENIYSSRIYVQLIGAMTKDQKKDVANLQDDYEAALKYLAITKYCLDKNINQRTNLGRLALKIL